jgi:3-deoxy-D-manno-octulosonate 8-phosphate phosphatase (KDO 8-P phosphatase)
VDADAKGRSFSMSLTAACEKIELILSDVDGVMTDGGIRILDDGLQIVKFHIRDGMGVRLWREAGKRFGIVTGRNLEAIRRRAADLWLDIVRLGVDDKLPAVDALAAEIGLTRERVRQIQVDALRRLRRILESEGLSEEILFR